MNTCDTCRHWRGSDLVSNQFKICQALEARRIDGSKWKDIVIFAGSGDDERNIIHTGPKFGCIHWEPIQSTEKPPEEAGIRLGPFIIRDE